MKRILLVFVTGFVASALCFAQARTAEINKGIFHQEGIASWYGGEFNGRPTASGEIFNDTQFTAAHPILPFGTMLKVTNQHNNKSVTVRVNDRGPFVAARIIDLSRSAAEQLDMLKTGTAPVKVESLHEVSLQQRPAKTSAGLAQATAASVPAVSAPPAVSSAPAPAVSSAPAAVPASPTSVAYNNGLPANPGESVQVRPASVEPYSGMNSTAAASGPGNGTGAYNWQSTQAAPAVVNPLAVSGTVVFHPAIPQTITGKNYRVQVGSYRQPEYAAEAFEKLKNAGLNPAYEQYGEYRRVVVAGLRQDELHIVSERLGSAGFREALLREE